MERTLLGSLDTPPVTDRAAYRAIASNDKRDPLTRRAAIEVLHALDAMDIRLAIDAGVETHEVVVEGGRTARLGPAPAKAAAPLPMPSIERAP